MSRPARFIEFSSLILSSMGSISSLFDLGNTPKKSLHARRRDKLNTEFPIHTAIWIVVNMMVVGEQKCGRTLFRGRVLQMAECALFSVGGG
jgi:hypothetical protein